MVGTSHFQGSDYGRKQKHILEDAADFAHKHEESNVEKFEFQGFGKKNQHITGPSLTDHNLPNIKTNDQQEPNLYEMVCSDIISKEFDR